MSLPTSVIVGPHRVPITYPKRIVEEQTDENLFGVFRNERPAIEVVSGMTPSRTAEILMHETLHALNMTSCFVDEELEERTITVLAAGLTKLAQDNPDFICSWLHHATQH